MGVLAYKYLDFPTLLVASIAIDVRATLVFFGLIEGPLHGFFHTFLGATVIALSVAFLIGSVRDRIGYIMEKLGISQDYGWSSILGASFIGAYSHIVLDAFLYDYLDVFYPFSLENPFYGILSLFEVYILCTIAGIIGLTALFQRIDRKAVKSLFVRK